MKKNDYLFGVASVRALENSLLKQSDLEMLINAESYKKAVSLLNEKGYDLPESSNYSAVLDSELEKAWDYVNEVAPESEELKAFIVKNDFQNLKAILKAEVMDYNAEDYFVKPCVFDPQTMFKAVSERDFASLPDFISSAAAEAYEALAKTGNGQLCDAIIDRKALEAIIAFAQQGGDSIIVDYAQSYCLAADIKTAFRSIKTKKSEAFIDSAVAETALINKADFVKAAAEGEEAFGEYLATAGFSDYKAELDKGGSAFEKYCDDKLLTIIKKAKMTAFGVSPIAAYFAAKETELKCLRIILSAKASQVSNEVIRERMRELYV